MSDEIKLYGVSSGDGNNGVSHMFANYYVRTNDPWQLARIAALAEFKAGAGRAWAERHMDLDGDADSTITAMFRDPPCEDTKDGEYLDLWRCDACNLHSLNDAEPCKDCGGEDFSDDNENAEDGRNWLEGNGAWLLIEVFPADEDDTRDRPIYDTIADAFARDLVA